MRRYFTQVNHGDSLVLTTVFIEGEECPPEGQEAFAGLVNLLRTIVDNPDMLRQQVLAPSEVAIYHTGKEWVARSTCLRGD